MIKVEQIFVLFHHRGYMYCILHSVVKMQAGVKVTGLDLKPQLGQVSASWNTQYSLKCHFFI